MVPFGGFKIGREKDGKEGRGEGKKGMKVGSGVEWEEWYWKE